MVSSLPVSVIVSTKNETNRIEKCLAALDDFDEVFVVDSMSSDGTEVLARKCGAHIVQFNWNGRYPKKRQWCLEHLALTFSNDWVFFVDADEIVTEELVAEFRAMDWRADHKIAGYFVRGRYVFEGAALKYGMMNNKLALFDRRKMEFPVVEDLGIKAMGEIEGHYQPVLKADYADHQIGQIKAALLHEACADMDAWHERHKRYAVWEREMDARNLWPPEDSTQRSALKRWFRGLSPNGRAKVAFLHSYVLKCGFLDGVRGFRFAKLRAAYYAQD